MHAVVGIFSLDVTRLEEQRRELEERTVPLLRHQPGFVSGTWSRDVAGARAWSVLVFETERAARKLADFIAEEAAQVAGLSGRLESLTVVEVLATAHTKREGSW